MNLSGLDGQVNGVVFYGINGTSNAAWSAQSLRCVKAPTQRLNVVPGAAGNPGGTLGNCNGAYAYNMVVQGWRRDPVAAKTTNLTDALTLVVGP